MKVLFLTSHPDGYQKALPFLREQCDRDDIELVNSAFAEKWTIFPKDYSLGISFFYNHLIPADQLTPAHTWINFHPAPLPDYRGRNVAYHAIMNEEKEFGATLHYVDETFDTGDIIAKYTFPIDKGDTAGDIAAKARWACLELFKQHIPRFLRGEKPMGFRQLGGTYYKKMPIQDEIVLTQEQQRQVRAITAMPYHAHTTINGRKYNIIPR
jgi:methionyl-tRNA formyltransferase